MSGTSEQRGAQAAPHTEITHLETRSSSTPELLVQHWRDYEIGDDEGGSDVSENGFVIELAAECVVGSRRYFAMEATGPVDTSDVVELEKVLSTTARRFISSTTGIAPGDLPWVARYALLDAEQSPPTHWMSAARTSFDLTEIAGLPAGRKASIEMGWGNGLVRGWDALPTTAHHELVRGIIDAQHIWHDASQVAIRNDAVFDEVMKSQDRPRRRAVRQLVSRSSLIEIDGSVHQLLFDDLIQNVQGVRRDTAESLLQAWNYTRFIGRTLDRIRDVSAQVNNLQSRVDSRYHAAVQATLLSLGFLVVIDTVLSFIGTAYSGAVDTAPGNEGGMFAMLRSGDSDLVFGVALMITVLLTALLVRRR